ncbi:MAG: type II toxin-antitoxin system VapC family toxin [Pseudomonadales bacterium]|nr:type II toxin-antitoxin system VapC family toxin [Pseudomonadales bacterium]
MNGILLDTHAFIWAVDNQLYRFSANSQAQLNTALQQQQLYLSAISLWEVAMLVAKNRIQLKMSAQEWLHQAISRSGIIIVPIDIPIATLSSTLALHGDPADRLIVASAICQKQRLCTQDSKILDFAAQPHSALSVLALA